MRPSSADVLAVVGLLSATGFLLAGWLDAPIHRPQDEGQLLVYPDLLLRGLVPQRDFSTSYPPGVFWLLAASYEVFGASLATERAVGMLFRLVIVVGTFALARSLATTGVAAACGAASLTMLLALRLDAYAWLGGLALLVVALALCLHTRRGPAGPALAGVMVGLALAFRLDLALAGALAFAPWWLRAATARRRSFAVGLVAGLLPIALHALHVSPGVFFEASFVEPVLRVAPLRRVGVDSLGFERVRQLALVFGGSACVVAAWWRSEAAQRPAAASLAGLAVGLLPQAFQRMDEDHLLYVGCVVAALAPAALVALARAVPARAAVACATALVLALYVLPSARLFEWLSMRSGPTRSLEVERGGRVLLVSSENEQRWLRDLVAALDARARPGQRLFVGPADLSRTYYGDLQFYFLFPELEPASYYLEMNPGAADRPGSRLADDLASADWIVTTPRWSRMAEEHAWRGSSEPGDVLRARFAPRARFGPWTLHGRRSAGQL